MGKNKTGLTVSDIGEFGLIEHIHKIVKQSGQSSGLLVHGIGDDAAVFTPPAPGYEMLVTCDTMVEGHHYLKEYITPMEIGRRAMVMNISDIGAMGGKPLYALVTLGLRSTDSVDDIEEIYRGFLKELEPFGAMIIGGNISGIDGSPYIDITLIGTVNRDFKVLRSGAMPGDAIMVTGVPGRSAAGCRILTDQIPAEQYKDLLDSYIRPQHRAMEGHAIAATGKITSMIDISDGLSGDLSHICEKSAVGAEIKEEMFPLCRALDEAAMLFNQRTADIILGASDDYELLFTCAPQNMDEIKSIMSGFNCPVTHIGRIVPCEQGMTVIAKGGKPRPLSGQGYNHFSK